MRFPSFSLTKFSGWILITIITCNQVNHYCFSLHKTKLFTNFQVIVFNFSALRYKYPFVVVKEFVFISGIIFHVLGFSIWNLKNPIWSVSISLSDVRPNLFVVSLGQPNMISSTNFSSFVPETQLYESTLHLRPSFLANIIFTIKTG